ncbi:MAG TPA: CHAT domain-containing protein, partial [Accumulibacter sp.]|uniref:CHAT domain-containing protein n=1 Tax=Accumulibacter sp. TaxID=2053492 RepID=UPI002BAAA214
ARRDALRVPRQPRQAADLVVCLRRPQIGRDVFELSLRSQIAGEEYEARDFGSFDLDGQELASYLADALDPSFARFPGGELAENAFDAALAAWNEDFLTTLADLGKQLWLHLPQPFRAEYLRLMGLANPPRSLFVFSDELSFPWEIVRPSGQINGAYGELPPLGVAHLLGRWRPGTGARPQPQALPVNRMAIVVPDAEHSGLPWAADEVRQLRALLPFAERVMPVTRRQLGRLFDEGDAQIVHFSGHGVVGANADLTALELEGGESITAMAFAASLLGSTRQPLLFLNACTVGRSGRVLGRAGGFAGNCIEAGWSGVVAPYWPVLDSSAATFGVAFYGKLKAGRSIGEALGELRREASDDPTALAYAYFGDPFARVLFG